MAHHQLVRHDEHKHEHERGQQKSVQVVQHEIDKGSGLRGHAERGEHLGHALHHSVEAFAQFRIEHADDHADVQGKHGGDGAADEQVGAQLLREQGFIHGSPLSPSCRTGA